jgi:hypothetical protein
MSGEAVCTSCGQDRVLQAFVSVAAEYDLKLYKCDGCLTHIWLVSRTSASNLQRSQAATQRQRKVVIKRRERLSIQ